MARLTKMPTVSLELRVQRRLQRRQERQRLTTAIARDAQTGLVRRGRVALVDGALWLWLPKRLESPNRWLWTHWRTKAAAKKAWATLLRLTVCDALMRPTIAAVATPAAAVGWAPPTSRVRVTIRRLVVRRTHYITDRDNLQFSGKGLLDCLVQAGFLRDDTDQAIDLHVAQDVSADGQPWTVIEIAPLASEGTP